MALEQITTTRYFLTKVLQNCQSRVQILFKVNAEQFYVRQTIILVILKLNALFQVEKINVQFFGAILVTSTHNNRMEQVRFTRTRTTDNYTVRRTITRRFQAESLNISTSCTNRNIQNSRRKRDSSRACRHSIGIAIHLSKRNNLLTIAFSTVFEHFNNGRKCVNRNSLLGIKMVFHTHIQIEIFTVLIYYERCLFGVIYKLRILRRLISGRKRTSLIIDDNGEDTRLVTVLNYLHNSLGGIIPHTRRIVYEYKEVYALRICFKASIVFKNIGNIVVAQKIIVDLIHCLFHIFDGVFKLTVITNNSLEQNIVIDFG